MPDNDLAARTAKEGVGWETIWDIRERAALLWAIAELAQKGTRDAIQP